MKKTAQYTNKTIGKLLLDSFPAFRSQFAEDIQYAKEGDAYLNYPLFGLFATFFINKVVLEDQETVKEALAMIEDIYTYGDIESKEVVLYGFLEELDKAKETDYKNIKSQLSPQLLQALNTIEDFWQGKEVTKIF